MPLLAAQRGIQLCVNRGCLPSRTRTCEYIQTSIPHSRADNLRPLYRAIIVIRSSRRLTVRAPRRRPEYSATNQGALVLAHLPYMVSSKCFFRDILPPIAIISHDRHYLHLFRCLSRTPAVPGNQLRRVTCPIQRFLSEKHPPTTNPQVSILRRTSPSAVSLAGGLGVYDVFHRAAG